MARFDNAAAVRPILLEGTALGSDPRAAEALPDPRTEDWYWHEAYRMETSCRMRNFLYEDFQPAYRAGYVYRMRHPEQDWPSAESALRERWHAVRGVSRLEWEDARAAVRAAWQHVAETAANDADGSERVH